jgi:hypothetical protein
MILHLQRVEVGLVKKSRGKRQNNIGESQMESIKTTYNDGTCLFRRFAFRLTTYLHIKHCNDIPYLPFSFILVSFGMLYTLFPCEIGESQHYHLML